MIELVLLLTLLAVTVFAIGSIFVSIVRTHAVPMPSSAPVRAAIIREASRIPDARTIVDLGSAWGGLAIALARANPNRTVIGIEASLIPYLVARARLLVAGLPNLEFRHADFRTVDSAGCSLFVCFLSPIAMVAVRDLFESGMTGGSWLVSALFAVRGWEPERSTSANDLYRTEVFVYRRTAPTRPAEDQRR